MKIDWFGVGTALWLLFGFAGTLFTQGRNPVCVVILLLPIAIQLIAMLVGMMFKEEK